MKFNLVLVVALFWAVSASAITIETVPVGDVGNLNDAGNGNRYGQVNYAYNIGKYEVTVGQYTAFLNAVAATDTYGLYNPNMATNANIAGISQVGAAGNYSYNVVGSPNHPVTYVSWGDAARFANWLHNGQPTGPQSTSTTEDGAYTLNGANSIQPLIAVTRNAGAKWFIPTFNEWYKVAYYQPASKGGDSDSYWNYPMRTNNVPYSDQPPGATPDNTRVGNFYQDRAPNGYDDGYAVTGSINYSSSDNYLTDVGAYSLSPSYYGTFDQGGNVYEWNEETNGGTFRGARGGAWGSRESGLTAATFSSFYYPTAEDAEVGIRVATSVPEPSFAMLAFAAGSLGLLRARRL